MTPPLANVYASRGPDRSSPITASMDRPVWECVSPKYGVRSTLKLLHGVRVSVRLQGTGAVCARAIEQQSAPPHTVAAITAATPTFVTFLRAFVMPPIVPAPGTEILRTFRNDSAISGWSPNAPRLAHNRGLRAARLQQMRDLGAGVPSRRRPERAHRDFLGKSQRAAFVRTS